MFKWREFSSGLAVLVVLVACAAPSAAAPKKKSPKAQKEAWQTDPKFDAVVDKITAQEAVFVKGLKEHSPMVETYIQNMKPDRDMGQVPTSDQYFLGRVQLQTAVEDKSYLPSTDTDTEPGTFQRMFSRMQSLVHLKHQKKLPGGAFMPDGFAQMIVMDMTTFDRQHYDFRFVRREFLGDVRTLVIDVQPKEPHSKAMFIGRLWAEDQGDNVVRFNGTYTPHPKHGEYMHFDSWRLNMGHDQWLPAYVFSEETDLTRGRDHWNFRAQTLLWGYNVVGSRRNAEFTDILVDTPDKVKDQSGSKQDLTAVEAQRAWERQAEDNVLDRMQKAALLAPEGEVNKVLNTVVNNLEVTNNLEIQPEVRCRVLMTQPMESFTVGHTIVVSRGLLDALPDEASLAAILAHEMGHIVMNHDINEKYAFSDRMIFPDETTISNIKMKRTPDEEKEADAKAVQLLQNSPYKDKLASAGLFLAAMRAEAPQLTNLVRGHFGDALQTEQGVRLSPLLSSAPQLEVRDVKQIAALPLGGRVKIDPWNDQLTIQKTRAVHLLSAREKMPFQITPMFPYLTRGGVASATAVPASTNGGGTEVVQPATDTKAASTQTAQQPQTSQPQ